jgi:hypothetical protein
MSSEQSIHHRIRRMLICAGCNTRVLREALKVAVDGPLEGHRLCPTCISTHSPATEAQLAQAA